MAEHDAAIRVRLDSFDPMLEEVAEHAHWTVDYTSESEGGPDMIALATLHVCHRHRVMADALRAVLDLCDQVNPGTWSEQFAFAIRARIADALGLSAGAGRRDNGGAMTADTCGHSAECAFLYGDRPEAPFECDCRNCCSRCLASAGETTEGP